ncbi:uncharacterized protein LOC126471147 [Schistocerca serialis cubense]|uniref:uncharacterized protein LOC126471147 n=1 Tax=Schistocerca serialis cubense TaxID=2023355 RepID=UPI00214F086F|nr:uncharacterized protein LOC126471147 [Schistocerca serialis cubense]
MKQKKSIDIEFLTGACSDSEVERETQDNSSYGNDRADKNSEAIVLSASILHGEGGRDFENWLKPKKEVETRNTATDQDESNADFEYDNTETHPQTNDDNQLQPSTFHHIAPLVSENNYEEYESSTYSSLDEEGSAVGCHDIPPLEEGCSPEIGEIVFNDPKKWPSYPLITDSTRTVLAERDPQIVDVSTFKFSVSDGDRRFDGKWFYRKLTNGERVRRQWLLYSQSEDSLFSFPCLLFGKDHRGKSSSFSDFNKGFNDCKHLNPLIYNHENSSSHRLCCIQWKDLQNRLKQKTTVDDEIQESIQKDVEKWRNIQKVVIDVIIFCTKNNLPLLSLLFLEIIGESSSGVF